MDWARPWEKTPPGHHPEILRQAAGVRCAYVRVALRTAGHILHNWVLELGECGGAVFCEG